jgi:hypothetical protein
MEPGPRLSDTIQVSTASMSRRRIEGFVTGIAMCASAADVTELLELAQVEQSSNVEDD